MGTDAKSLPPCYAARRHASLRLLQLLSPSARARNVNEHNVHSHLMMHPELLATFIHSGQPLFVRQETRAGEGRIDVLIYFYGSAHFDIIECKGRAQPLIGTDGRLTAHCWKAIEQVS